jgi:hypothetical protein
LSEPLVPVLLTAWFAEPASVPTAPDEAVLASA